MELWHGFKSEAFEFEGYEAIIVFPKTHDEKKNWALKTEYWDAFPEEEIELLNRGFHVAWVDNVTRFATVEDCDRKARFVKFLSETYGLRDKCVPVGMSCGGAHAVNFAGYHPECVACIFIDAPVLNFCSYPGKLKNDHTERVWAREFVVAYAGVTRADLLCFEPHPLNRIDTLLENKIHVIMSYGTDDAVVPYHENGQLMEEKYTDAPELLVLIARDGEGHHPHGIPNEPQNITNYILEFTK
jgi:pimeloyl-ACP methyl ester carboxylesterase